MFGETSAIAEVATDDNEVEDNEADDGTEGDNEDNPYVEVIVIDDDE